MTRTWLLLVLALGLTAGATHAVAGKAKPTQVRFVGPHPIPKAEGGGVCHIQVPHVHVYVPTDVKLQYRVVDDGYYFVGDPVAYGWDGPKYTYEGHHPIPVGELIDDDDGDHDRVEYCYIDGPHYHYYAPPAELSFVLEGDAYWYTGDLPAAYVDARAELDPIDVVYEPLHYTRPVVVVEPPTAWVGLTVAAPVVVAPVVVAPRAHAHVEAEVVAPSLRVEVALPTVVIGGGVIVTGGRHHHDHHDNGWHGGKHKHKRGRW